MFHVNDDDAEEKTRVKIVVDGSEACETYQYAFEDSYHYGTTVLCRSADQQTPEILGIRICLVLVFLDSKLQMLK